MKTRLILFLLVSIINLNAQDSTKVFNHEIGFNTVGLVRQLISSNPSNTLTQSPFHIIYNLYYKDSYGYRAGLGMQINSTETSIFGQVLPRKTDQFSLSMRNGFSYNFLRKEKIAFNAFADVVFNTSTVKTANTSSTQSFPNPVEYITTETSDKSTGIGGAVGFGVKYNFTKHISVYAESYLSTMYFKSSSEIIVKDAVNFEKSSTDVNSISSNIVLPATVYLILRF